MYSLLLTYHFAHCVLRSISSNVCYLTSHGLSYLHCGRIHIQAGIHVYEYIKYMNIHTHSQ